MSSVCSAVQTIKSGDGSKTQFSFDFPYVFKSEVHVYFWNTTTKEYDEKLTTDSTYPWRITDANPTIVEFTGTAPPAPPSSDDTANVKIRRITNIDDIQALFNPGSAIRSDDLNSNFEQLRFAIQESLCPDISEAEVVEYLQDFYWNNFEDTVTSTDTWDSSDTKIATTAALDARFQDEAAETITSSETWPNDDNTIATTGAIGARHDVVVNTNVTPPSSTITGKQWLSTAPGNQVFKIYDGSGWRTVAVGQPYSPATTTVVRYVDVTNGSDASDVTGFLPQAPLQSIARALELVNASSSGDGTLIKVAAGVYQETLPLRIEKNNISIVGESMRSCFVHPTVATENNDMFEVDSGSYIANLTLLGLKVPTDDQGTRNNSLDNDATYGLPSNQPFAVRFRTDSAPTILKSPYIQNCTHFSDAHFDNQNFDPNTFPSTDSETYSAVAGDETSAPCGGGLLVDGAAVSSSSPIRSMVVDAFTQITLDGPGILVTNNGYAQLVSFFGTFAHYHAKAKNGGQINLSNCVTDFGRYGLIADGKSPSSIATATANAANSGATTITIGAITTDSGFHGTVSRPLNHMMVTIDGVDYGVVSSTANGSGWDIVLTSGLTSNITNTTVSFALRSYISTGGHTFEYVGVGTDYSDHPDKGGVPIEANQVIELNGGKVWQSSTDHVGKFKAGDVLVVDQVSETVDLKDTTVTGNITITGTVDGRDVATDGTKLDGIATGATAYANSDVDAHLNQSTAATNEVLSWNGSDYDWVAQSGGGLSNNATGTNSLGVGTNTLDSEQSGAERNVALGDEALTAVTTGDDNVAIGYEAGKALTTATKNICIGSGAGKTQTASQNIYIGYNAGQNITSGHSNTIIGDQAQSTGSGSNVFSCTAIGQEALNSCRASGNTGVGRQSLRQVTTGTNNTALGKFAGDALTTGANNIIIGNEAEASAVTVSNEITLGNDDITKFRIPGINVVLKDNGGTPTENHVLTVDANGEASFEAAAGGGASEINDLSDAVTNSSGATIGLGSGALANDDGTNNNNVAIGKDALNDVTSGTSNIGIGPYAGSKITTLSDNVYMGYGAGEYTANPRNVGIGNYAGRGTFGSATAFDNVSVGYKAGENYSTGYYNALLGNEAGHDITTGQKNTFCGFRAGDKVTTGTNNIVIGYNAAASAVTVSNEITLGDDDITSLRIPGLQSGATDGQVLTYNSTNGNITLADAGGGAADIDGLSDGHTNAYGSVGLGANALANETTTTGNNKNTATGEYALTSLTSGYYNVANGWRSLQAATTAYMNVGIGYDAGRNITTGIQNVIVGHQAGYSATTVNANVYVGESSGYNFTGARNTAIGWYSMYGVGTSTGSDNTCLGNSSGLSISTGNRNTCIGKGAGDALGSGSNNLVLGYNADPSATTVSNEITLGDVNIGTLRCNTQTISSLSDGRDKTEVEDLPLGLEFINTLRPVKFKWDTRDGNGKDGSYDAGFIAQDLQSAQSASNAEYLKMVMDSNPDRLEASYGQLIPVLVQAIKDLKTEIDTLKANA